MRRLLLLTAIALAGCATGPTAHESWLAIGEAKCQADPTQPQCTTLLPQLRAIVAQEKADQQAQNAAIAAGVILLPLAILAAGAADDDCCCCAHFHHWH